MAGYLGLEPLLVARLDTLRAARPLLAVLTSRDLAEVREADQRLPALHVLYLGDSHFSDGAADGRVQHVDQTWGVIVATRDLRDAAEARASAGELLGDLLTLCQGWRPGEGYGRLHRVQAPGPLYRPHGVLYIPVYFTCRVLWRGDTD